MANLKDVRTVPELESLTGEEKVLVNVDGSVAQARVDLIKPKTGKELMYEWSFDADDNVHFITENVTEDISWLTYPTEDSHFEMVVSSYATEWDDDIEDEIIIPEKSIITYTNYLTAEVTLGDGFDASNGPSMTMSAYTMIKDVEKGYDYELDMWIEAISGIHLGDYGEAIPVGAGGNIFIESFYGPIKSVKIYKVTK